MSDPVRILLLLPSIRSPRRPHAASLRCCPRHQDQLKGATSHPELCPKGRRAAAERCRGIAAGTGACWGRERSREEARLVWVENPCISLHLGSFQSESLAAGQLARRRPPPGRQEKFIGLERFQTQHCWLSEAGLFSKAISHRLQCQTGLFL